MLCFEGSEAGETVRISFFQPKCGSDQQCPIQNCLKSHPLWQNPYPASRVAFDLEWYRIPVPVASNSFSQFPGILPHFTPLLLFALPASRGRHQPNPSHFGLCSHLHWISFSWLPVSCTDLLDILRKKEEVTIGPLTNKFLVSIKNCDFWSNLLLADSRVCRWNGILSYLRPGETEQKRLLEMHFNHLWSGLPFLRTCIFGKTKKRENC